MPDVIRSTNVFGSRYGPKALVAAAPVCRWRAYPRRWYRPASLLPDRG